MPGSPGGQASGIASSVCTTSDPIARSRYHLRSAGTTYQGAHEVEVLASASS